LTADPVSWFLIESGWKVVAADGESVGSVDEIIGDSSKDIFNGLAVSTTFLGKPRYVAAEDVAEITEGTIRLKLAKERVERLGEYEEPPTTAEILPDDAGPVTRAESAVEAPIHRREQSMNVWRRLWFGLRRLFG
jgi:hypothetical protein